MNTRGTLADLIAWAKGTLPGEETRAQSAITTCRKADLFTKGGRGRHAPFAKLTDFPTAILAILHNGAATKSDKIVQSLWNLPLSLVTIDDPARSEPIENTPDAWGDHAAPYLEQFNLDHNYLAHPSNLIGFLTHLFDVFAPHRDFYASDRISLETCGEKMAVQISLHGGNRYDQQGYPGAGPAHSQITFTFGDLSVFQRGAIKTTRTIDATALNNLSQMTPNLTKGGE